MNVDIKEADGKTVVTVVGELDTQTSTDLQAAIAPLMDKAGIQVEMDMAGVDYISSKGLRVILALEQAIQPSGGHVKVLNLTPGVREVFDLTGFSKLFL